jgi:hypothetical protein
MENGNFHLFAANGNGKWKIVFLFRQMMNGKRRIAGLANVPVYM